MRVLLVEDDQAFSALVGLVLGHGGFDVVSTDRVAGVAERAVGVDLVVTDGAVLDGSALDVLETLAAEATTAELPVVICSVRPDAVVHPRIAGRIAKPIDPTRLADELRSIVGRASSPVGSDADDVVLRSDADDAEERLARQAALQELELRARCIGDAGAAVLCSALDEELRQAARLAAHRSVGLVGALGEPELGELGQRAESLLLGSMTLTLESGPQLCAIAADLEDAARNRLVPSPARTRVDTRARGRGRLMVIDDDEPLNGLIRRRAARAGLEVTGVNHGREALELLVSGTVAADVVLLDVDLPGLNGFAVLNGMATAGLLEHTNVILATVHATEAEIARARAVGAVDDLSKPYDLDELLERVLRWCPA